MRKLVRDKKFDPDDQYVVVKPMRTGDFIFNPGDEIDISIFTRRRARQMLEWGRICKRKEFNETFLEKAPEKKEKATKT